MRDYLRSRLGFPAVQVELDDPQLDIAIENALAKFNHYLCKPVPRVAYNQSGGVTIDLLPGDRGVVNVKILYPVESRVYSQMDLFQLMYRMVFPRLPIGEWYMLRNMYEQYQRTRGSDPDWFVDESTNTLHFDCAAGPFDIFYVVARDLEVGDIETLKPAYQKDFKDYALAEAKDILARIRGKFGGSIPVPGGTLSTDAVELKTEAEATRTAIETRLESIARYTVSPVQWG